MSAAACRSSLVPCPVPAAARAKGEIRAAFARTASRTGLADLHQSGGLRLHCPKVLSGCEAVVINTAGGIAGGDTLCLAFAAAHDARVTLTTPSAERIYRAQHDAAEIDIALSLAPRGSIAWLPQETILFEGAALRRRFDVDMAGDARIIALETYVFGRLAMGETHIAGRLQDRWRVRRDGRLIFAEDLRLAGRLAERLDATACGKGARAVATLLYVAPDAEAKLAELREGYTAPGCDFGASAWNSMLFARLLSPSPELLRSSIIGLATALRGCPAPQVWQ
jgi:urease accessory protein